MFANWKTSLLGIASIISALAGMITGKLTTSEGIQMILAGVTGLFAKDYDKTGGAR